MSPGVNTYQIMCQPNGEWTTSSSLCRGRPKELPYIEMGNLRSCCALQAPGLPRPEAKGVPGAGGHNTFSDLALAGFLINMLFFEVKKDMLHINLSLSQKIIKLFDEVHAYCLSLGLHYRPEFKLLYFSVIFEFALYCPRETLSFF